VACPSSLAPRELYGTNSPKSLLGEVLRASLDRPDRPRNRGQTKVSASKLRASLAKKKIAFSSAHVIGIGAKLPKQASGVRVSPLAMCKSI
jgi:hypothetical protein